MSRAAWFVVRHRSLARLVSRGPIRAWLGARIWADLLADPVFVAGMEAGQRDFEAGRTTPWAEVKARHGW